MGIPLPSILANNTSLPNTLPNPTAVFVGATAGIGLGALQALTKHTTRPNIYIVGRSPTKLSALITDLAKLNPNATFHPIVANDLTKIADALAAAKEIAAQVQAVDLLIMSPGYVTFAGRDEHPGEGVDKLTAVRYYSRMAFVVTLRPALQKAAKGARVVSVLAGGKEGPIWREDLLLKEQGHYGVGIAGGAASSMTGLFFEEVKHGKGQKEGWGDDVVFAHVFPGVVSTGLDIGGLGTIGNWLIKWIARPIIYLVGYTQEEAGERVLYVATSGRFAKGGEEAEVEVGSDGIKGSGVYLVGGNTAVVPATKELVKLRENGMGKVVYEHTIEVLEKVGKGERA